MELWIISFFIGILIGNLIDIKYILFIYFIYHLQYNDQTLFNKVYGILKEKSNFNNIAIPNVNMMFLQQGWMVNTITSMVYGKKEKMVYDNDNNNNINNTFLEYRKNKYNIKHNIKNDITSEPFFSL
jgi:hypothetical protein